MIMTTVVLPVYNGLPYLIDAVNSVITQSMTHFKMLIINDGSTDGTSEYLASLKDPRINVICQENMGLGATLNRAIRICDTQYITRMDADDIMDENRLYYQIMYLEENKEVVAVGCQLAFIVNGFEFPAPYVPLGHDAIVRRLMETGAGISHAASTYSVAAAQKIGGYRVPGPGQDLDFFIRLSEVGKIANLNQRLYKIRIHKQSYSITNINKRIIAYDYAIFCARLRKMNRSDPDFNTYRNNYKTNILRTINNILYYSFAYNYRKYLISRGNKNMISAVFRLLLAVLCNPVYSIKKMIRMI